MKKAVVFIPKCGIASEVWAYRQARSFTRFQVTMTCWELCDSPSWGEDSNQRVIGLPWVRKRILPTALHRALGFDRLQASGEKRKIQELLGQENSEVALCHFGWTACRAYEALKASNIPFVVIFHGLDLADGQLKGAYRQALEKVLRDAKAIVVVGSHMIGILKSVMPGLEESKVHIIPCGAPVSDFAGRRFPERGENEPLRAVSVGRLFDGKGIDLSLRAIAAARRLEVKVIFDVLGDGPERSNLEALALELGIAEAVNFRGVCNPEQVAQILSESHVFLQPSRKSRSGWIEGFGVSITEAMATGLPIVASKSGGIPDQVRDGVDGVLGPEEDVDLLCDALLRYESDEGLRRIHGRSARERSECFDSLKMSESLESLLIA